MSRTRTAVVWFAWTLCTAAFITAIWDHENRARWIVTAVILAIAAASTEKEQS